VVNGQEVVITEQCVSLEIRMGECNFVVNALVCDLANRDLILGMPWLHSLGNAIHDWKHAWLQFTHEGTLVRLQGLHENTHNTSVVFPDELLAFRWILGGMEPVKLWLIKWKGQSDATWRRLFGSNFIFPLQVLRTRLLSRGK
jgi:hypothetical protein